MNFFQKLRWLRNRLFLDGNPCPFRATFLLVAETIVNVVPAPLKLTKASRNVGATPRLVKSCQRTPSAPFLICHAMCSNLLRAASLRTLFGGFALDQCFQWFWRCSVTQALRLQWFSAPQRIRSRNTSRIIRDLCETNNCALTKIVVCANVPLQK